MELLIALMLQSATALPPRLPYAFAPSDRAAARSAGRAGVNWQALDRSLADDSRRERRARPMRRSPAAAAPRETMWNGVPVRIIDGQVHGIW